MNNKHGTNVVHVAKGPLAELVIGFQRHPSGPKFDPSRGRISGWRVIKSPHLSHANVQVCGCPISRGCGAAVYGWGQGSRVFHELREKFFFLMKNGGDVTPPRLAFF